MNDQHRGHRTVPIQHARWRGLPSTPFRAPSAFWSDKHTDRIEYRPSATDELALAIADVVDSHA